MFPGAHVTPADSSYSGLSYGCVSLFRIPSLRDLSVTKDNHSCTFNVSMWAHHGTQRNAPGEGCTPDPGVGEGSRISRRWGGGGGAVCYIGPQVGLP